MNGCRRTALLIGGDAAALLVFAAIGRKNHGEGLQLAETFNTALPFLVGPSLPLALEQSYIACHMAAAHSHITV